MRNTKGWGADKWWYHLNAIVISLPFLGDTMSNIFASIEGACGGAKAPEAPPPGQEAPPPYTTLPAGSSECGATAWTSPPVVGAMGYNQSGFKLGYMDFVPRMIKKKLMGSVYEDFRYTTLRECSHCMSHSLTHAITQTCIVDKQNTCTNLFPSDTCTHTHTHTHTRM